MTFPTRLYESLLTAAIQAVVDSHPLNKSELLDLDPDAGHEQIARHLANEIARTLRAVSGDRDERLARQVAIANSLLDHLRTLSPEVVPQEQDVLAPPRLLLSLHDGAPPARTELPYSISALLTRTRGEPALGHELAREIMTADSVDALVSFVTLGGVRALRAPLEQHAQAGKPLRLLTTTYMGATDASAIEWLARLPHVEVRVSYDARRTRLHAKAWLFSRESGLHTAYVGSANLSSSALFEGHEWMIKAAAADLPQVLERFRGTFETLWNDPEFEPFDPENEVHRDRLRQALSYERGGKRGDTSILTFFTLKPHPFQQEILDKLEAERHLHGRTRNLVVAATGTGKTVVSAFDYQRRIGQDGLRPRLLFLAHREELLTQAMATFRQVLRDGAFGSLLVGGSEPVSHDHLFATIQSFNSRALLDKHGTSHWDHVIVDECHHAPADSYRAVIERIAPKVLVGLTATPERTDGRSLLGDFDGHIAAELRLWNALEKQLLVPFEYYGISDNVDLRDVRWSRGAYQLDDLDKVYTGNDRRAELIFDQTRQRVGDMHAMRALGFCVSVAHAEFMAKKFSQFGVPSVAVHGDSPDAVRQSVRGQLERREVNVIFTCDLYNEGIDLPFVDTLLMLRSTSSATLFLQQLGRGLRLHEGKPSCLVLDFIGQHREDFRFDGVLSAMTGLPRPALREAVERGFPLLPTGCHLALDRVVQEQVLASLRRTLQGGIKRLTEDLRVVAARHGQDVDLGTFLAETGRDLAEVFNGKTSWSMVRRAAGLAEPEAAPGEEGLTQKLKQVLHIDEPERLTFYRHWLTNLNEAARLNPVDRRRVLMLAYQMFHERGRHFTPEQFSSLLAGSPTIVRDLDALFAVLADAVGLATPADFPGKDWPLAIHRQYGRREVLTALGRWNENAKPDSREGVVRLEAVKTELLFVTLKKGEKRFSPTTRYDDYAISRELFHWQTQSQVSPESVSGQRYICQVTNGWRFLLFVRATVEDVYTYLGPVHYVSHSGSRPMSITWKLEVPLPGHWLQEFLRLAS